MTLHAPWQLFKFTPSYTVVSYTSIHGIQRSTKWHSDKRPSIAVLLTVSYMLLAGKRLTIAHQSDGQAVSISKVSDSRLCYASVCWIWLVYCRTSAVRNWCAWLMTRNVYGDNWHALAKRFYVQTVAEKLQREILLFLQIPKFLYKTVKPRKPECQKQAWFIQPFWHNTDFW